jgi:hypothetical protein
MREALPIRWLARRLAVTLAIALAIGTIGPFGTFGDLATLDRYAYWLAIVVLNWLQILAFSSLIRSGRRAARWPAGAVVAVACVAASIPASFEVAWLEQRFRPGGDLPAPAPLYGYVLVLSLAIAVPLANQFLAPRERAAPVSASAEGPPAPPPFLRRVPDRLGCDLLCLESEDHYLRVYTRLGNDLVLCRLSDAIAELGGLDGRQVHRSWWVARSAVVGVERDGRKLALRLENGIEVPISRTFRRVLRNAGWLG